ncbi:MAG TPA: penicillin-binding transpeptidase domain-containing protein [Candidatus Acidoferrales bacterium]|nr:penicillin-binding transpeptidase domain-containing protein [Candidatus Acidoferrales bacterium]
MEQRTPRLRWLVVWVFAVVWTAVVVGRLSYLQLFCYGEYLTKAQHQQQRVFEISPKRGVVYDRKGRELAISLPMDSVFGDPTEITDAEMVARLLAPALGMPADDLETKIREAHTPVRLAKKLPPETVQRIQDMNLRGVFFQKENRRVYPQHELAAHVLGYVDVDEKGNGGIEYSLDKQIRGRPGKMMVMADGRRRWYDRTESAADPGGSVVLTIDQTIQYIAEKELERAIQETHANNGTVVVQDPNTGQLLAVAVRPTFDPNNAGSFPDENRMDRAVSAAYEPGSTFKVVTMTGAIENGAARPSDLLDCQMGSILVAGRLIHDWHPFGVLSVQEVLAHSSDVGSIKVALRLGAPKFYETMRVFGIGQLTGIELPGENRGLLRPLENWTASSIGSLAIGQEVSVTPVQIVSAISAIANGGTLYRSRIVREVRGGASPYTRAAVEPEQVTDARTAATVREMMETVILEGTGKPAQLDGYTAAGKSGTAQKIDPATGRYSPNQYNSSFVGFAPVNEPAVTILVVLDSPVGAHHGGEVGGPVFKRVAEQVLTYLDVPRDVPSTSDVQTAKNSGQARPQRGETGVEGVGSEGETGAGNELAAGKAENAEKSGAQTGAPTIAFGNQESVVVPILAGQTVRSVTEACSRLGLVPALIGSGVALEQSVEAGTQVVRGTRLTVRFGKAGRLVSASVKGSGN